MNQNIFDELNRQKILLREKEKKYEYKKKRHKQRKGKYDNNMHRRASK